MQSHKSNKSSKSKRELVKKIQVVIFTQEASLQVLLLQTHKKRKEFWQNITGTVEGEEDFLTAAKREIQEETGIEVLPSQELIDLENEIFFHDQWNRDIWEKSFLLILPQRPETITLDCHEHQDYRWRDIKSVTSQDYFYQSNFESFLKAKKWLQRPTEDD